MPELENNNIVVKINRGGEITVQNKLTAVGELVRVLQDAKESSTNAELVLDVDDEVEHELVVKVLDAAGGAQIEKILFVTHVPAASGGS
jgi:biopolymer transport protein ExbD